jgi:hypothetical protein
MTEIKQPPRVPKDLASIVKPEELVDVIEMTPLTLHDRRLYNLLLGNAWNTILQGGQHQIPYTDLTKYLNSHNYDIPASLRRLMSAIVAISIPNNRNGQEATRQVALLGANETEIVRRGMVFYSFPPELIKIVQDSKAFARIHTDVMFKLSSKYSLALYEFLQRRKNLSHIFYEVVSVEELRGLLGVPKDTLKAFGHLNDKAIKPSIKEVSFLSDYEITAEPIRTLRAVTHVKFSWSRKEELGSKIAAVEELQRSEVGRKARMKGTVESIAANPPPQLPFQRMVTALDINVDVLEKAKQLCIQARTGWDIYVILNEFVEYAQKNPPQNVNGAFIGFVKKKIEKRP